MERRLISLLKRKQKIEIAVSLLVRLGASDNEITDDLRGVVEDMDRYISQKYTSDEIEQVIDFLTWE